MQNPIKYLDKMMNLGVVDGSPSSYRQKIKGYHLAFNVQEPLNIADLANYQYKAPKYLENLSAEDIKKRVAASKLKRLESKK